MLINFQRRGVGTVSPTNPLIQQLVQAIATQEGTNNYNNPGNLLYLGQPGTIGQTPAGFGIYSTPEAGAAAEANQIALVVNRGTCATGAPVDTLTDLIAGCLTPASLNPNVSNYVANVASQTGIDPNASLSSVLGGGVSPQPGIDSTPTDESLSTVVSDNSTTLLLLAAAGIAAWLYFS